MKIRLLSLKFNEYLISRKLFLLKKVVLLKYGMRNEVKMIDIPE